MSPFTANPVSSSCDSGPISVVSTFSNYCLVYFPQPVHCSSNQDWGSIKIELELVSFNSILELERELELKDLAFNEKELSI